MTEIGLNFTTSFIITPPFSGSTNTMTKADTTISIQGTLPDLSLYANPSIDDILQNINTMAVTTMTNMIGVISVNINNSLDAFDPITALEAKAQINPLIEAILLILSVAVGTLTPAQATQVATYLIEIQRTFSNLMVNGTFKEGFSGKITSLCRVKETCVIRGTSNNRHLMNNISLLNVVSSIQNENTKTLSTATTEISSSITLITPPIIQPVNTNNFFRNPVVLPGVPTIITNTGFVPTNEPPYIGTEIKFINPTTKPVTFPTRNLNRRVRFVSSSTQSSTPQQLSIEASIVSLEQELEKRATTFANLVASGSLTTAQINQFNTETRQIESQIAQLRRSLTILINSDPVRNAPANPLTGFGQSVSNSALGSILTIFNSPPSTEGMTPTQKTNLVNKLSELSVIIPEIPIQFLTKFSGLLSYLSVNTYEKNSEIVVSYTGVLNDQPLGGNYTVNMYALSYLPIEAYYHIKSLPNEQKSAIVSNYGLIPSDLVTDQEIWNAILVFLFTYLSIICFTYLDPCNSLGINFPCGIFPNIMYSMKPEPLSNISNSMIPSSGILAVPDTRGVLRFASARNILYYMFKRVNQDIYFSSMSYLLTVNTTLANLAGSSYYIEESKEAPSSSETTSFVITSISPSGTQPLDTEFTIFGSGFVKDCVVILTRKFGDTSESLVNYPQPFNITRDTIRVNFYYDTSKVPETGVSYTLVVVDSLLTIKFAIAPTQLYFSAPIFPANKNIKW